MSAVERRDGARARGVEAGFGPWVWLVVALVCATCAGLVVFQSRQGARNAEAYEAVSLLRQSRLELTKGFLHLAESGRAGSAFSRGQGMALVAQATGRLERDFAEGGAPGLTEAARELREALARWPEAGLGDVGYAAELRARFLAVERAADASDRELREGLRRAAEAGRRDFAAVALAAAGLVGGSCCALLLLRRRGERAARAARESDARFAAVVEQLGEGLILIEGEGGAARWNPAALALYGLEGEARGGVPAAGAEAACEVRTPAGEPVRAEDRPLARVARGETLRDVELRVRPAGGGGERIFSHGGGPVRDGRGWSLGFVTIRDVTARREAERGLRELNAELERRVAARTAELEAKNRELETFTYSVSHDLKAPLRGIDGYGSLLESEKAAGLDEEGRVFIARIRQASGQMGRLIDDLLAYSRLERSETRTARVGVAAAVRDQLHALGGRLEAAGARVADRTPGGLVVRADPTALEMVLRNLLDNALKFARPGQAPEIEIDARREAGGGVTIRVADRGVGFEPRYAERIFEIFQRLHRAEDYPGTGVGLAIVRRAMTRMGGRAWAEGRPGEGATFFLWLPEAGGGEAADAAEGG